MRVPRHALYLGLLSVSAGAVWAAGCGAHGSTIPVTSGSGGDSTGTSSHSSTSSGIMLDAGNDGNDGSNPCTGLACQINACPGNVKTTITGTVYDPAGKNPLYGVVVYVPNATPAPIAVGASCYTCSELYTGTPIAAALTGANGQFTITNAPDGANIPLVIQIGKWRRQFVLPSVGNCTSTAVPDGTLTLPKNGSEGDLPHIGIMTGGSDTLECLLYRMGVDKAEYVGGASTTGHIHIFQGVMGHNTVPPGPVPEQGLWDSFADIMKYDTVMLACEGEETVNMNQQVLFDYTEQGGRVLASHFNYSWFYTGPFSTKNLATWLPNDNGIGDIDTSVVTTTWNGTPFARGQAFHDWLLNVGALDNNALFIVAARHNANVTVVNTPSQPWLVLQGAATEPQQFTFDTPLGVPAAQQCGRVTYTDMHISNAAIDYGGVSTAGTTPAGCVSADLTPQELALEFSLFDLSSCVTPNNMPQMPMTQ
jgi:hypothetical protein